MNSGCQIAPFFVIFRILVFNFICVCERDKDRVLYFTYYFLIIIIFNPITPWKIPCFFFLNNYICRLNRYFRFNSCIFPVAITLKEGKKVWKQRKTNSPVCSSRHPQHPLVSKIYRNTAYMKNAYEEENPPAVFQQSDGINILQN